MKRTLVGRLGLGIGVVVAAVGLPVSGAQAATSCSTPVRTNSLLPGESGDSFSGIGWALRGSAKVTVTRLADGAMGPVLDLPPRSSATSPVVCAPAGTQSARMLTRSVGAASAHGSIYGVLSGIGTPASGLSILSVPSWTSAYLVGIAPRLLAPAMMTVTIANTGSAGDMQLYNLFIDPQFK
jgi:hypothetical protein